MNWWYYLKKRFAIFPGFLEPVSATFLRDYYQDRKRERRLLRALLDALVYLLFQLWVPVRARYVARTFGLDGDWVKRASGIARRRFADPNDIAVFRIEKEGDLDRYMRRFEYAEISKRINPAAWRRDCVLADKAGFARLCAEFHLPAPLFVARVRGGSVELEQCPNGASLAVKPTSGMGGAGFFLLDYPHWAAGEAALCSFLRSRVPGRGDWLVQAKVAGHPELADLALNALSTARLATMRNERGEIEIVASAFRFAGQTTAKVDNLAAGGLLAHINLETGTLGSACYGRKPGDFDFHPVTAAAIAGRILPNWTQACELVLRAHRTAFHAYSMIGWDIGMGREGPMLIEGNGKPGLFAAQRATRQGVGETRFGSLIAYHLAQAARREAGA